MAEIYPKRNILCIDLKSFFASCECVERGIDPFTYPLVVANPKQGNGAITLAVTPYLKKQGVKSRGRLYEIDKHIKYEIVKPRMNLYIKKSKEVISIYLDYVSDEDLHIYSIDECFLDVTNYLKMYKKSDEELAMEILDTVYKKTGLTATCGIGPNMLLAKIAMDIEAKHNKNNIAKWTYQDIEEKLWPITPLSNMWGIGRRMEKRLNQRGIYSVKDLALTDKNSLKDEFGIMGLELWNHANGIDLSKISDYHKIAKSESFSHSQVLFKDYNENNIKSNDTKCQQTMFAKSESFSHSQVLFKDYNENNIKIIISEMVDVLAARLRKNNKLTGWIGLGIGYSKEIDNGFFHSVKLDNPTDSAYEILRYTLIIFDKFYEFLPIRKVTISCGSLKRKDNVQLNLFESEIEKEEKQSINETIDEIKNKFGKNSLLKATNLLKDSTAKERNLKIGGHYS